jgi:cellulose synthase/poly-beta-1,6-N-acetylglucosamine synthase-like glycosyltransferase
MQQTIISISFVLFILYAALIIYYAISWRSIPFFERPTANLPVRQAGGQQPTFSIIIPARNEEQHINACLYSICNQTYPAALYEVIVVDDHSTDNTAQIVQNYASKNIKLISLKEITGGETFNSYKKKAIETAIAQATGELIITTDADCEVNTNWLQTIAAFYQQTNAAFIAMPVKYSCNNSLLEIFQALDFLTLQGITGASVYKRIHSMCNGANLAYTKKIFEEVNGFKDIDNIASGDDMLLMHKIYTQHPDKVFFLKSKDVIVQTQPQKTIKDFFNQRIRWASKADKYDDKRIFAVLLLVYLFNVIIIVLPLICLFNITAPFTIHHSLFTCWLYLLIIKTAVELFFLYPVAKFFNQQKLLWWFPFAQPFHVLYTVIAGWLGKFGSYQWKGRSVK